MENQRMHVVSLYFHFYFSLTAFHKFGFGCCRVYARARVQYIYIQLKPNVLMKKLFSFVGKSKTNKHSFTLLSRWFLLFLSFPFFGNVLIKRSEANATETFSVNAHIFLCKCDDENQRICAIQTSNQSLLSFFHFSISFTPFFSVYVCVCVSVLDSLGTYEMEKKKLFVVWRKLCFNCKFLVPRINLNSAHFNGIRIAIAGIQFSGFIYIRFYEEFFYFEVCLHSQSTNQLTNQPASQPASLLIREIINSLLSTTVLFYVHLISHA